MIDSKHQHDKEATTPVVRTTGKLIHWARVYDLLFARKPTEVHKKLVKQAALKPGERALDVGCGPGTLVLFLATKVAPGGEAVGIDASPEMIERATQKARKAGTAARFEMAAIESLPFADASFDVATSTFMLHHLPHDVQATGLSEVRRVLKPGGRLFIADFESNGGSFLGHLLSVLGHAHGSSTFPALEADLRHAGFEHVEQITSPGKGTMIVEAS